MNAAQKESSMIFGSKSKIVVLEILFRAVPIYFFLSENHSLLERLLREKKW